MGGELGPRRRRRRRWGDAREADVERKASMRRELASRRKAASCWDLEGRRRAGRWVEEVSEKAGKWRCKPHEYGAWGRGGLWHGWPGIFLPVTAPSVLNVHSLRMRAVVHAES